MPLSEALAARHEATRPWWHKAATRATARIPPSLHGRWALSTTAAVALALMAATGAAVGGWYLTRSQGSVVEVGAGGGVVGGAPARVGGGAAGEGEGGGGGKAGEANTATDGRDGRLGATGLAVGSDAAAAGGAAGRRFGTAEGGGRADACLTRPAVGGAPRAVGPASELRLATRRNSRALGREVDVRAAASGTFRALGLVSEARVAAGGAPRSVGLVSDVRATANGVPRSVGLVSDVRAAASGTFRTLAPEARTRAAASGMSAEAAPISAAAADAAVARAATSALIQGRLASAAGAQPGNLSAVHALASSRHHSPTPQPCLSHGAALSNAPPSAAVIVDVEGKVAHPGVLSLPVGARVYEAVAAAGGALAGVDATALDLARPVVDGEQLRVGIAGEAAGPVVGPSGAAKGKRKGGRVVNLNTATVEELQAVPGVGPAMAERILEWRAAHGGFTSVGQLRQVRGIGERKFAEMRDSVTV